MPAVEVRVLGPVQVVGDAGAVALAAKHVRVLAALVIANGDARGVDELVEAVWGASPPPSARKLVQVYVSRLRKTLPPGVDIATRSSAYALELTPDALDAARFERLLADAGAARRNGNPKLAFSLAERALWHGRAYGDLAYEDFARADAERLEELRVVAREERLVAGLDLGRHEELLGEALALATEHPSSERPQELAMLALYATGRQSEALEHYAATRACLTGELGLEPGPALRDLQRRILQQDPSLEVARPETERTRALPASPNELVGREREVRDLRAVLDRRQSRLIVLTGAGGSGKTRLALEVARQAAGSYANGVLLVELAPLRDPALVVPSIARALELEADAARDMLGAVTEALTSRELLLVLDNAEHLREAAPAYAELVARAPRVTLLVTSRAVLHVSGEHVFPVAPLGEENAFELFVQRARLLEPTFQIDASNEEDVREICRRVDGLPLAIELAAARIRTLPPRALRERLGDRLTLLTGGPRDLPARQQTLRQTIEWSVDLLHAHELQVLARLAVFPGGASLHAAESVCGATVDILGTLVDGRLVERERSSDDPRFRLLETIREYALELLGEQRPETEAAMARHLADLLDEVELEARVSTEPLSRLDAEIDNVRAALEICARSEDAELELRLAGSFWRYCYVRGIAAEGLRHIERALATGEERATAARARALYGGAGLAWSLGDLERAKELGRAALRLAAGAGSTWDEIAAHTIIGVVANDEGDRATARRHHERSLQLKEELGLEPVVEKLNLAIIALDSGAPEGAQELLEDVLAYHQRTENVSGIGFAQVNLGVVHHALGDHESSVLAFREARHNFEQVGFRAPAAHALQGLAAFEASTGSFEEAARLLGRARDELDEIGSREDEAGGDMLAWTMQQSREALGEDLYEAAYAAGREVDV